MASNENLIEQWAREEYRRGVSAGAAARQLCRTLGATGAAPTLKRMLEDMLASSNRANFDRSMILKELKEAAPEAARATCRASFKRINGRAA